MNKTQLKAMVLKWKKILRLEDWDISIAIVDQSIIDKITMEEGIPYQADALNRINQYKKECEILLSSTPTEDMEKCFVHEMLHLKVHDMDTEHRYAISCISDESLRELCTNRRIEPLEQVVNEFTRIFYKHMGK